MANVSIFIHNGGISKLLCSLDFKMVLISLVAKVFQKGTMSAYSTRPVPSGKSPLGSPVKIAFRGFLFKEWNEIPVKVRNSESILYLDF